MWCLKSNIYFWQYYNYKIIIIKKYWFSADKIINKKPFFYLSRQQIHRMKKTVRSSIVDIATCYRSYNNLHPPWKQKNPIKIKVSTKLFEMFCSLLLGNVVLSLSSESADCLQGCQMFFSNQKSHLGKFWRALEWKILFYFMTIWNSLRLLA
jgi:hypothetical protein